MRDRETDPCEHACDCMRARGEGRERDAKNEEKHGKEKQRRSGTTKKKSGEKKERKRQRAFRTCGMFFSVTTFTTDVTPGSETVVMDGLFCTTMLKVTAPVSAGSEKVLRPTFPTEMPSCPAVAVML